MPDPAVVRITLRVTPRSSKNEVIGWDEQGTLRVRIRAAPVDGEANAELVSWLSKKIGLPKKAIRLVHGESGRLKTLEITGMTEAELKGALQ
jgi:uncharacterized protein (TIGR00251 family)